jgi:hypothetical protein
MHPSPATKIPIRTGVVSFMILQILEINSFIHQQPQLEHTDAPGFVGCVFVMKHDGPSMPLTV